VLLALLQSSTVIANPAPTPAPELDRLVKEAICDEPKKIAELLEPYFGDRYAARITTDFGLAYLYVNNKKNTAGVVLQVSNGLSCFLLRGERLDYQNPKQPRDD
jgi:hypothetical protein